MTKMDKYLLIFIINLSIFLGIDYVFGKFYQKNPEYLNTRNQYLTNYRNYFTEKHASNGEVFYEPDNSTFVDNTYKNKKFEKESLQVLAIGDSFTAGQGVKRKDVWIKQLEKLNPDKKLYGINYGISGANIRQIEAIYQSIKDIYHPQLVVYALVLNDPIYNALRSIQLDFDHKNSYENDLGIYNDLINNRTIVFEKNRNYILNFIYHNTNIGNKIIQAYENKKVTKNSILYYQNIYDPRINQMGLEETYKIIVKIKNEVELRKGKFLVMIFPLFYNTQSNYPFENAHRELQNSFEKNHVSSLDLLPYYRGIKDSDLWVHPVDQHPNDYAHKIAATALINWINLNVK